MRSTTTTGSVLGALMLVSGVLGCGAAAPPQADLVLRNGHVVTVDSVHPEAQAIAVAGDTIVAVGSDEEIAPYVGPGTRVIDLGGQLAIPGFIEGHGHFMGLGRSLMELDLTKARSWDDIVAMVADAAKKAKPGEWILGRGWHQEKWDHAPQPNVEGLPYNTGLSRVSPDNPVLLTHASGHGAFANAKALELAGIGPRTADPEGGEIVRDRAGVAIGMLRDRAVGLVSRAMQENRTPEQQEAELKRQVELASQDAISKGITSFQDQGETFATIDFLKRMVDQGVVPLRLYVLVDGESPASLDQHLADYRTIGYGGGHLTVRAIGEVTSDGALGTHSAWMLEPYSDLPGATGLNVTPMDTIRKMAEIALRDSMQVAVHAIGDRANRETLDVFQQVFQEHPEARDLRWRIEHAQHLSPQDIPRFGQMGVIASMQALHACSDGPYVVRRLGEQRAREGAYVWQSLLRSGAVVLNGTDTPVEDANPIPGFYCSVTRKLKDGSEFFPAQVMSRAEALRSYTLSNAYAAFEEGRKGSLTAGKLADIVVLDRDIMAVPPDSIPGTKVLYTIVGGRVVYEAGGAGK